MIDKRECGSCTKCCEGWLSGNVYGHEMFNGRKCYFLNDKCSIYKDRPKDPCIDFNCAWITEQQIIPEWLKPNLSDVIILKKKYKDVYYYEIVPCGEKIKVEILQWILETFTKHKINVKYFIGYASFKLGTIEFIENNEL